MKNHFAVSPLSTALKAAAFGACAMTLPLSAHALVVTTTDVGFDESQSVSDLKGKGTTQTGLASGSSNIAQFDASLGVLTDATLNMTSSRTLSVSTTATAGGGKGNNNAVTAQGSGSSGSAQIAAPGVSRTFSTLASAVTDTCKGFRLGACDDGATSSSKGTNLTGGVPVNATSLDAYVGTGTVQVNRTLDSLSAKQTGNAFTGTSTTTATVNWAGSLSATYTYLLHAAPTINGSSSSSITLDLGSFMTGTPAGLQFTLSNLPGERVGLDLNSIVATGDTGVLNTDLSTFSELNPGDTLLFNALLDTSNAGSFASHYQLSLSDAADVGAASSHANYTLDLYLTANVEAPVRMSSFSTVPEPASMALVGAGIFGLGWARRRRS